MSLNKKNLSCLNQTAKEVKHSKSTQTTNHFLILTMQVCCLKVHAHNNVSVFWKVDCTA